MIYTFGDCEVDTERRELVRGGIATHVEPQVFDVLVYLLRNRERVVSKEDLFKDVWRGRIVTEGTLNSRINAARKAIGEVGARQKFLRTIARRGFRFSGTVQELDARKPLEHRPTVHSKPEKPSVAVMPFANLSADADQEYFADGIAEDLIAGLSRIRWLRVIARGSTSGYKGRSADPRQVARDLGVRYIVSGSVRRDGEQLRIPIELVDAAEGTQVWSQDYRRQLRDIFRVQDEIAQSILGAVAPELEAAEWERSRAAPAENLDAWDHYHRGTWHLYRFAAENIAAARRHCQMAIAADPEFPQPHSALAYAAHLAVIFDYSADRELTLHEGFTAARRAVQLDDRDSFAHAILGRLHMMAREHDRAVAETRIAIDRNPYSAQAYFGLGFALATAGKPAEAIEPLLRAVELSPRDPNLASYGTVLSTVHLLLNQATKAVEWAQFATRQPSSHFIAFMHLAAALALAGDARGAAKAREELLRLKPGFNVQYVRNVWPFSRPADEARIVEALRKAGF